MSSTHRIIARYSPRRSFVTSTEGAFRGDPTLFARVTALKALILDQRVHVHHAHMQAVSELIDIMDEKVSGEQVLAVITAAGVWPALVASLLSADPLSDLLVVTPTDITDVQPWHLQQTFIGATFYLRVIQLGDARPWKREEGPDDRMLCNLVQLLRESPHKEARTTAMSTLFVMMCFAASPPTMFAPICSTVVKANPALQADLIHGTFALLHVEDQHGSDESQVRNNVSCLILMSQIVSLITDAVATDVLALYLPTIVRMIAINSKVPTDDHKTLPSMLLCAVHKRFSKLAPGSVSREIRAQKAQDAFRECVASHTDTRMFADLLGELQ